MRLVNGIDGTVVPQARYRAIGTESNGRPGGRTGRLLFATHPSAERRLEVLAVLEKESANATA